MALQEYFYDGMDSATSFASTTYHDGQTWTTTSAYILSQIILKLYRHATTNPGNVTCYIYATSGDLPTGSVLYTSDVTDCSGITTSTDGEEVTFTFSEEVNLSDATKYAMVILSSNSSPCIYWKTDGTSPTYSGGLAVRAGNPTWYSNSGADHWFETYSATENVDISGTIAGVSGLSGILSIGNIISISGTIAGISTVGGALGSDLILSPNWQTDTFKNVKRLIIVGNDSLYYEDI